MKKERESERVQLLKTSRKPQMLTVMQLQQELADLQSKYAQLCSKLDNQK